MAGEEDLVDVLLRVQEKGGLQFLITAKNIQGIISVSFHICLSCLFVLVGNVNLISKALRRCTSCTPLCNGTDYKFYQTDMIS